MNTTIVSLVLASILGLMYSNLSKAITLEAVDKELKALQTRRRDNVQLYYNAVLGRMTAASAFRLILGNPKA